MVVGEVMKNQLLDDTGVSVPSFRFCDRSNGTYLDCPLTSNADKWIISVFNPSL